MKKILWTLIIISCLSSFAGCKSSDNNEKQTPAPKAETTEKKAEKETEKKEESTAESQPAEAQPTETQPETAPAEPAQAAEAEAPAPEKEYVKGSVNGKNFESEFLGFRFSGTDNWVVLPEEEVAKYPIEEYETTELMAYDGEKRGSITIKTVTYTDGAIDANVLASRIKYLSGQADSTAASAGGQIVSKDDGLTATIAGQTYNGTASTIEMSGTAFTINSYVRKVSDSRLVEITVSVPNSAYESADEIINLFTPY